MYTFLVRAYNSETRVFFILSLPPTLKHAPARAPPPVIDPSRVRAPFRPRRKIYFITALHARARPQYLFPGINLPGGLIISASVVDGFSHQLLQSRTTLCERKKKSHKSIYIYTLESTAAMVFACDRDNYCTDYVEYYTSPRYTFT